MYSVKFVNDDICHSWMLVITDENGEREYWDDGEPEDATFARDFNWIAGELEKAYQTGVADGKKLING